MTEKNKKEFQWEAGKQLKADEYEPVKEVRQVGFTKLADGVYVDPLLRKEERKKKLVKPFKNKKEGFMVEESTSGLSGKFNQEKAAKLIRNDSKGIKGIFATPKNK